MEANMKLSDALLLAFAARDPKCPSEADVLGYSENTLSSLRRVRLEKHFAECDDCRQLLTFLGEESVEEATPLSQAEVSEQANRVLGYIRNDEHNQSRSARAARPENGFRISYPALATVGLVVCAIVIAAGFFLARQQAPADAGMEALRLGLKDQRRTEARLSGGLEYSRYTAVTRGDDPNDDNLHFDRALGKLRSAEQENAPASDRLALARVYLARGARSDIDHALIILDQLAAHGGDTAPVLNDIGVGHMQRGEYDAAIDSFSSALAKSPRYDEALFNKALAEQRAHHNDDAKKDWQQYIDQASDEKWKAEAADHVRDLSRAG
jgi:tetratricopeptide (TPR) repeat protein